MIPPAPPQTSLYAVIRPLLARYRWSFVAVVAMMPLATGMAMLVPYLTKVAIDDYIVPAAAARTLAGYGQPLLHLVALALAVVLAGYAADAIYVLVLQRTGQHLIADLREAVFRRTLRLPRSYFDSHPIGTILTRVTSDIEALGEGLATNMFSLVLDLLKSLAYLGVMFYLEWRLTLVVLVLVPVLALLVRFFQVRIRRTFFATRQALAEATGYLQECLNGMRTIQLFGAEQLALERFRQKNERFLRAQNTSNFYDAVLYSLVESMTMLAMALVLWYSAGELQRGALTIGVLVAFMEYIQRLIVPLREFTQQVAVLQRAMAALDHIDALFKAPLDPAEVPAAASAVSGPAVSAAVQTESEQQGPEQPEPFRELAFEDVRFRYRQDGPEILRGISFRMERGETLAIVGPTGSGKSTVIRLLIRAYSGYEGSIRLNGEELRTLPAERLSRLIAVVHQGVFLYQGSYAFNIGLERPGVDRARVEQAARYVSADTFIEAKPGAYDAPVLQGGANLSAGQAQLLAFARAISARTDLIVLDEATSSVDSMTEHLIQQAVAKLYRDKSVIAIAHRLSTIRSAHTILVLDKGLIVERGSHAGLMAQAGLYAKLVGELEARQAAGGAAAPGLPEPGPGLAGG